MDKSADVQEVEAKRRKVENNFAGIKAILADEFTQDVELTNVIVSCIEKKQQISQLLGELGSQLPLTTELQHLKRVNRNEMIVCKASELNGTTLENYLKFEAKLSPSTIEQLCHTNRTAQVPGKAVKLRWQYESVKHLWPCKFHPDKYLESLYNDASQIGVDERIFHLLMARLLHALTEAHSKPFGICVDPRTQTIIAIASTQAAKNPMMHCPMVLVDCVAQSQGGGAWNCNRNGTAAYIPKSYCEFILSQKEFANLKIGVKTTTNAERTEIESDVIALTNDNLSKYGPYLCTGYDVYLGEEPCLMCAMALVHSRAKRIFLLRTSSNGALVTRFKLHAVKELNHHYEVFQFTSTQS